MAPGTWRPGASVRVRGRRWRIEAATHGDDCTALRLSDATSSGRRTLTILTPFDRPFSLERRASLKAVRPRRWLHEVDRALVDAHPYGGLAHLAGAAVRVMAYQLEPALAVLRHGATRVLVADGVGLGKTIQAGLVLLELNAASDSCRALVLAPAGLRDQWRRELQSHFHLASECADAEWLRRTTSERPPGINPWSLPGIYVASHDFVKRPEALRALEDVGWDIVVVDEAHAAAAGTDRRAAIHAIAGRALRVMILTATPPAGDAGQFAALCQLGRVDDREPPPAYFARPRADLQLHAPRRTGLAAVRPTAFESAMHRALERYSDRVWREASTRGDDRARLASIVLRKRALSSAGSLLTSLQRRIDLLGAAAARGACQLLLPLDDEDPLDDTEPEDSLAAPGLTDAARERRWLAAIAETARAAARDESKTRWLLRFLRRVREPVVVFTEYRDTLARLERRIAASGRPLAVLHGGLDPRERAAIVAALDRRTPTLLATDAAAEGLNLHHHSRIVIHYELPWSPARLEQRAGRVDRIGQTRRVHEVALVSSTPAERLVLRPLALRVARASTVPHAGTAILALNESRVAEAVMAGDLDRIEPQRRDARVDRELDLADFREEAAIEAARVERCRLLQARSRQRRETAAGAVASVLRLKTGRRRSVAAVYAVSLDTAAGRRVHSELAVAGFEARPDVSRRPLADLRALLLDDSRANPDLIQWLDERARALLARIAPIVAAARRRLQQRRDAIARTQYSAARRIVQLRLLGPRLQQDQDRPGVSLDPAQEDTLGTNRVLVAAILRIGRAAR